MIFENFQDFQEIPTFLRPTNHQTPYFAYWRFYRKSPGILRDFSEIRRNPRKSQRIRENLKKITRNLIPASDFHPKWQLFTCARPQKWPEIHLKRTPRGCRKEPKRGSPLFKFHNSRPGSGQFLRRIQKWHSGALNNSRGWLQRLDRRFQIPIWR